MTQLNFPDYIRCTPHTIYSFNDSSLSNHLTTSRWLQTMLVSVEQWLLTVDSREQWLLTVNNCEQWLLTVNNREQWLLTMNNGEQWLLTVNNREQWLLTVNNREQWLSATVFDSSTTLTKLFILSRVALRENLNTSCSVWNCNLNGFSCPTFAGVDPVGRQ